MRPPPPYLRVWMTVPLPLIWRSGSAIAQVLQIEVKWCVMDRKREEKELKSGSISPVSPSFSITHGILLLPWGSLLTWRPFLWFLENLKQEKGTLLVVDPDLQIGGGERGGGSRPDPEVRGGTGPLPWIPTVCLRIQSSLLSLLAIGVAKRL